MLANCTIHFGCSSDFDFHQAVYFLDNNIFTIYVICIRVLDSIRSIYMYNILYRARARVCVCVGITCVYVYVHVQPHCKCRLTGVSFVKVRNSAFPRHCRRRLVVRLGSDEKPIYRPIPSASAYYYTIRFTYFESIIAARQRILWRNTRGMMVTAADRERKVINYNIMEINLVPVANFSGKSSSPMPASPLLNNNVMI